MNRIWNETTWKVKQEIEEEIRKANEEQLKILQKKLRIHGKYKSFIDNAVPIED